VRRWAIGFFVVLLACIPILVSRGTGRALLTDSDTAVLIQTIRERDRPFSWFVGDWPLFNHFYRPIPTLTFEVDTRLYGDNGDGYGMTNALIAIACVLALFWYFRELTDNAVLSAISASVFALWSGSTMMSGIAQMLDYGLYVPILAAVLLLARALARHFKDPSQKVDFKPFRIAVYATLVLYYGIMELDGDMVCRVSRLSNRMIAWLPGRTASVMAVFCMVAMAAYARYERCSAVRRMPEPSPLDPPATKSSKPAKPMKAAWIWPALAIFATASALASYEQAIMLPASLLATAILMRMRGYRVRWGWQAAFWFLLLAYFVLRKEVIPPSVSRYQHQQLRFGPAVYSDIMGYVFPTWPAIQQTMAAGIGPASFLVADTYTMVFNFVANFAGLVASRKKFIFALAGWALSILAFLPMAWVKPFVWYDYWPMAFRALFAVTVFWVGLDLLFSAVMPQKRQAPARRDPAPGSLPHL
jgi:hypothetical protein